MKRKINKIEGYTYERGYVYNFHFHLVWVTKYRHPIFTTSELVEEMKELLSHIAESNEIIIEKMEVMPDHVHMLISFKPKLSASTVVKVLKGGSGRLFLKNHPEIQNKYFWGKHIWSNSYFMSTLGDMSKETVRRYIENQYTGPDSSRD